MILSDWCLCAKAYVLYTDGANCVCLCRASSMWRDYMRVPVCLCRCVFLWVPRAVPQLSLNKFRAPLGNRGLVLGLNVSYFFRSFGTSPEWSTCRAANSTKRKSVADIITASQINCGQCWPILRTPVTVPALKKKKGGGGCFVLGVVVDVT